jgi:hypothetical protein
MEIKLALIFALGWLAKTKNLTRYVSDSRIEAV